MNEQYSEEKKTVLWPEPAEAHVVRWYMQRINDAYESGSGSNADEIMNEMHGKCDDRVIRRVEVENQLARQSLRLGQSQ